jgi:uncharacterized protein
MIELTVESVRINLQTSQRVVILKAKDQDRYLFIWIAHAEAYAIAIELQGSEKSSPRPLTHDLLKNVIEGMGGKVTRIVISDQIDDIFYASIIIDVAGTQIEIDSRPSDAVALAIRTKAPIFVAESVLERSGVTLDGNEEQAMPKAEQPTQEVVREESELKPEDEKNGDDV